MGKSKNSLINSLYFKSPVYIKNLFATLYGYKENGKRYGSHYINYLLELKQTEYLKNDELENIQVERLKSFLKFASAYSTYYNKLFNKCDLNPSEFKDTETLKKLPILEKEEVRKYSDEISCKRKFKKTYNVKTSGSTGKPMTFSITDRLFQENQAVQQLLYYWNGLNEKSKMAKCAGQPVAPIDQKKPPYWVTDYYNNNLYLSSYHLSERNLKYYIKKLESFNPDVLEGYPSSIYLLALANKKYQGRVNPRFIRTGSETLLDYQRQAIENSFDCKVHNFYGSGENCVKAIECPKGKMHLQMLYGYTEILNHKNESVKPGEIGRIIATGFSNSAFPLIRYNTGDLAILSDNQVCDCRRGGIILNTIVGRDDDYILTPDNKYIRRLGHIFHDINGIINVQLIQENVGEIVMKIAKDDNYTGMSEKIILKKTKERLGDEIEISFQYVDEIPKEKNGKYKFIISNIAKDKTTLFK